MIEELTAYYKQRGISALDFRCPHLQSCRKDNKRFVEAKGAFVGTEYEKGSLPRLLFVSLDPGDSDAAPEKRTVESVRFIEEHRDVDKLPKGLHWYRTHELAWILLKAIKPDLRIQESHLYFAHVNSVKCCVSNDNHKSASPILFNNCQKYVGDEVVILKPDILVTQGKFARLAIEHSFNVTESVVDNCLCSHVNLLMEGRPVLWFHTYHPRNYGLFNKQRRECFGKWVEIVSGRFPPHKS